MFFSAHRYRPDLVKFATTNTAGTTGDGVKLAMAVGADAVELEHVQVRPRSLPASPLIGAFECKRAGPHRPTHSCFSRR